MLMSMGAERVWEWRLATGETVVAKLEASSGNEAVFVDAHVVSRARRSATPGGHDVRRRGVADGAYRGSKQVRVFFRGDECSLEVDGEVVMPLASPESGALSAVDRRSLLGVVTVILLVIVMLAVVPISRRSRPARHDAVAPTTVATVPPLPTRLPSTESHRSSNGLLTLRYPADFHVTADVRIGEGASVVHLDRRGDNETMELFSERTPDTTDLWKLDGLIQAASEKSWAAHDTRTLDVERSDGKCHGEDAAITLRHISARGSPIRQWSCTFVHEGHAFRLTTFTPDWLKADESYLRSLVEGVSL